MILKHIMKFEGVGIHYHAHNTVLSFTVAHMSICVQEKIDRGNTCLGIA